MKQALKKLLEPRFPIGFDIYRNEKENWLHLVLGRAHPEYWNICDLDSAHKYTALWQSAVAQVGDGNPASVTFGPNIRPQGEYYTILHYELYDNALDRTDPGHWSRRSPRDPELYVVVSKKEGTSSMDYNPDEDYSDYFILDRSTFDRHTEQVMNLGQIRS